MPMEVRAHLKEDPLRSHLGHTGKQAGYREASCDLPVETSSLCCLTATSMDILETG